MDGFWNNFQGMFLAWPYQNCSNCSTLQNKIATRAKNRTTFKQLLILNGLKDFAWVTLYQNCSNYSNPLDKMTTRAKNRRTYKMTSPSKWLTDFENFTKMFVGSLSTKIAQTLHSTLYYLPFHLYSMDQVSDPGPSVPSCLLLYPPSEYNWSFQRTYGPATALSEEQG